MLATPVALGLLEEHVWTLASCWIATREATEETSAYKTGR
jgi:hypothetical protein